MGRLNSTPCPRGVAYSSVASPPPGPWAERPALWVSGPPEHNCTLYSSTRSPPGLVGFWSPGSIIIPYIKALREICRGIKSMRPCGLVTLCPWLLAPCPLPPGLRPLSLVVLRTWTKRSYERSKAQTKKLEDTCCGSLLMRTHSEGVARKSKKTVARRACLRSVLAASPPGFCRGPRSSWLIS